MLLEHDFTVPVPMDDAWRALLDVERVAPCMPGATLGEVHGDDFDGQVKVRVGPVTLTYKGTARFAEKDESAHRAVIEGKGKDTRGNGTASATVTATLSPDGDNTRVDVRTDLTVTGRPAQFGRGMMADVGGKLISQFADCLAGQLSGDTGAEAASAESAPSGGAGTTLAATAARTEAPSESSATAADQPATAPRQRTPAHAGAGEAIDLFATAGPAMAKRAVPAAAGILALVAIIAVLRRRHRR
ncbi:MAG: SRPBCC family protein [Streptosporangiales bacterium]